MKKFISNRKKARIFSSIALFILILAALYILIHIDLKLFDVFDIIKFDYFEDLWTTDWLMLLGGIAMVVAIASLSIYFIVKISEKNYKIYFSKTQKSINELKFPKKKQYARLIYRRDKLESTLEDFDYTLDEKEAESYMELADKKDEIQKLIDGFEDAILAAQKKKLFREHDKQKNSSGKNPYDREFVYKTRNESGEVEVVSVERGFVENKGIKKNHKKINLETPDNNKDIVKLEQFKEVLRKLPRVNGIPLNDKIEAPTDILRPSDFNTPSSFKKIGVRIIKIDYQKPSSGNTARDVEISFKLGTLMISKKFDYVFNKSFEKKLLDDISQDDIALPASILAQSPAILSTSVKTDDFKMSPEYRGKVEVSNFNVLDVKENMARLAINLKLPNQSYDPTNKVSFEYVTRSIQKMFVFKKTNFDESIKYLRSIKTLKTSMKNPTPNVKDLVFDTSEFTDNAASIESIAYSNSFKADSKTQSIKISFILGSKRYEVVRTINFPMSYNERLIKSFNSKDMNIIAKGNLPKNEKGYEAFINKSIIPPYGVTVKVQPGKLSIDKRTDEFKGTFVAKAGKSKKEFIYKFKI